MSPESQLWAAPMEGITGKDFREAHAAAFPAPDRYYLPFLSPTADHHLTPRQLRELDPGPLDRALLVPQVLTRDPEDFLWAAKALGDLGFSRVNLNLGCPSGTVVSKGKGAGLLRDPETLARFLDEIFARSPLPISLKTRIGLERPEEWDRLLPVLAPYPMAELILHPRTRREMYRGGVHFEAFRRAAETLSCPLCYNGNLFTPQDVQRVTGALPGLAAVMAGRGLLADPSLFVRCRGGERSRAALAAFHEELADRYLARMHPDAAVLPKFKELWAHLRLLLAEDRPWKTLRKAKKWADFHALALSTLETADLLPEPDFSRIDQFGPTL